MSGTAVSGTAVSGTAVSGTAVSGAVADDWPMSDGPADDGPGLVVSWTGGVSIDQVLSAVHRYQRHRAGLDLPAWGEVGHSGKPNDQPAGDPGAGPQDDELGEEAVTAAHEDRGHVLSVAALGGHAIMAPGPDLAGWLACGKATERDDAALVTSITAWRKVTSWAQAQELAAVAELARRRRVAGAVDAGGQDCDRAADAGDRDPVADTGRGDRDPVAELEADFAPNEVALALTLTQGGAEYWMDLAVSLTRRLPATLAALGEGTIDLNRAKLIDQYTSSLDAGLARTVERRVLVRAEHRTTGQLRASLQRAVLAADPAAAERRRQEAQRRAWVALFGDHDGTASLSGRFLPAAQAAAAWARICAMAKAMEAAGAGGGMDLLRAQVFVGLLLGTLPLIPPSDGGPEDAGPGDDGPESNGPEDGGPMDAGPDNSGPKDDGSEDGGPEDAGPGDGGLDGDRSGCIGPEEGGLDDGDPEDGGLDGGDPEDGGLDGGDQGGGRPDGDGPGGGGPRSGDPASGGPGDSGVGDSCVGDSGVGHSGPCSRGPRDSDGSSPAKDGTWGGADDPRDEDVPRDLHPDEGGPGRGAKVGEGPHDRALRPADGPGGDVHPSAWPPLPRPGATPTPGCARPARASPAGAQDRRGPPGSPGLAGRAVLCVPWRTLAGWSCEPGELSRIGPVTAGVARDLALAAAADVTCDWKVIVVGRSGRAVAVAKVRRSRADAQVRSAGSPSAAASASGDAGVVGRITLTIPVGLLSPTATPVSPTATPVSPTATPAEKELAGSGPLAKVLAAALRAGAKAFSARRSRTAAGGCTHEEASPDYRVPDSMRALVEARDQTCGFPTCRQPAWRCEQDHTIAHRLGGLTCPCNLSPECPRHHHLKHLPSWRLDQPRPGVLTWTTPARLTHTVTSAPYPA